MSATLTIRPEHPRETPLLELAEKLGVSVPDSAAGVDGNRLEAVTVTGVTMDSRDVRPGDLYLGVPGANQHGASFAAQARESGAVAMLTDAAGADQAPAGFPVLVTDRPVREIIGEVSLAVYGSADGMKIFGVTGTNGKTSVIYALATLLGAAGLKTGLSSTAERRIGDEVIESRLTSPEATELHALLAKMRESEVEAVAVEVSAHALVRNRLDGVVCDVAAFNNFSQDHLDDFGTMESYFAAKKRLFTPQFAKRGVVVVDSIEGVKLAAEAEIPVTRLATEFGHEADWHLAVTRSDLDGVSFVLQGPNSDDPENNYFRGSLPQFGKFMAENAALALIMLHEAGIPLSRVAAGLERGHIPLYIPGRLEEITDQSTEAGKNGPRFFVDYGHTPGSFEAMLDALGEVVEGNIIFVFGADGDRDPSKRAAMGAIAAQGAAHVVFCDYNPRFEDPAAIRAALIDGAQRSGGRAKLHEVPNPGDAIREAIRLAGKNDVILYAGPGHETTQEVAGEHIPFSARDEVRGALREAGLMQ